MKSRVEAFWRAFEAKKMDEVFATYIAPDCEFTMPGSPTLQGATQMRPLFEAYLTAFPDMRHETVHAVESGDTYAAETRFAGTHRGPLRGPKGEVAPTGKEIRGQSADIIRFRGDKIVSWHVYHDQIPFLAQLGLL
jgi:ketosteroid isomerase-like protein